MGDRVSSCLIGILDLFRSLWVGVTSALVEKEHCVSLGFAAERARRGRDGAEWSDHGRGCVPFALPTLPNRHHSSPISLFAGLHFSATIGDTDARPVVRVETLMNVVRFLCGGM